MDRGSNAQKCLVKGCGQCPTSCDYVAGGKTKESIPNNASNDPEYLRVNAPREYLMQQHLSDFKNRSANGAISLSCTKIFVNLQRAIMELRSFGVYLHGPIANAIDRPK